MLIRPFFSVTLAALSCLSACTTVPPSSLARLAALSPLEANPDTIRVAVIAPENLIMKPGDAVLSMAWFPEIGEPYRGEYPLDILSGNATAPQLLSRLNSGQRMYVLRLTGPDAEALFNLQRQVNSARLRNIKGRGSVSLAFRNACWNGNFPVSNEPMPIAAFIRLSSGDEYLPLLEGLDIKDILKIGHLTALPNCNAKVAPVSATFSK